MKDTVCLIPTWLTAGHALGAANSLRKYYPEMPIYFVDDVPTEEDIETWKKLNHQESIIGEALDTDSSKLIGYPNSAYILREHRGFETAGHGNAITDAMKLIHAKWVVHMSADTRIIKEGCLEYMMEGVGDKFCGTGQDFARGGKPNLGKWLCIFRGDLYHKYNCDWTGSRETSDAGQANYFGKLTDLGFKLKYCGGTNSQQDGMNEYFRHLTNVRTGHEEMWDQYYE